jgi:hypothetical protein
MDLGYAKTSNDSRYFSMMLSGGEILGMAPVRIEIIPKELNVITAF